MNDEWENKKESFESIDVRKLEGNFLPLILEKAKGKSVGEGLCVIQRFEPIPLYSALKDLGFEYQTDKVSETEYRVYFHREEKKSVEALIGMNVPLKPTAIVNFKAVDDELADITVKFWKLIWEKENPAIEQKTKYLLSLANGVGGGRFRQATRELVKAYSSGLTVEEMDEVFEMFAWNQGIGCFASEIGPSPLFGAYQLIKKLEDEGKSRAEVVDELIEKFGEENPDVGTSYRGNVQSNTQDD